MTNISAATKWDLDTPSLVVDLDLLDQNIARMAQFFRAKGVNWRPHTKGQKIPEIAHLQLAAGALGITCAKLSEAEVMAQEGIRDILIANQVVGEQKASRLAKLLDVADVIVAVDSLVNGEQLSQAANSRDQRLRVVVEVDNGIDRAGVPPGERALSLAQALDDLPGLRFVGLMAWEAHCLGLPPDKRQSCCDEAVGKLVATADLCRNAGLPVEIVSCGGTGTYWISAFAPGITEVEAGGGIYGCGRYRRDFGVDLEPALTILTTVTSRPDANRIICDAGFKSSGRGFGEPEILGCGVVESFKSSAEHGSIFLAQDNPSPRPGEQIEFVPGYSDATVFLHDYLYGVRAGRVEVVWPVVGRGKLQ